MRRVVSLSLIVLLMLICLSGTVYAAPECNMAIQSAKSEFSKGEEFTLDVNISGIKSERGVIAVQAVLEFDKDSLELKSMEGQNNWSSPVKDVSYNEANGKIVIDKNGLAKNDETILKLTFKVKDTSKNEVIVSLKDINVSDATDPYKITSISKKITVTDKSNNNIQNPSQTQKPGNTSQNTYNKGKLPQTGVTEGILLLTGTGAILLGITFFIKMKKM